MGLTTSGEAHYCAIFSNLVTSSPLLFTHSPQYPVLNRAQQLNVWVSQMKTLNIWRKLTPTAHSWRNRVISTGQKHVPAQQINN